MSLFVTQVRSPIFDIPLPNPLIRYIRFALIAVLPFACASAWAQTGQDCDDAVQVCYSSFVQNTLTPGFGAAQELAYPANTSCLASGEQNSNWYIFTVNTSGTLEFEILPNAFTDDYDWAVFNITNSGCAGISSGNVEVVCNYSVFPGPTGMSAVATPPLADASAAPLEPNFSTPINISANQTYAMVVNNATLSTSGYTLNFTGTAGLLDTTTSAPLGIAHKPCDQTDTLVLTLSEAVQCASISPDGSDFIFTGPNVGAPYSAYGVNCLGGGVMTNEVTILLSQAIMSNGLYQLSFQNGSDGNTLLDLCDNPSPVGSNTTFDVTNLPTLDLGNDTAICEGDVMTLDAGNPGFGYMWSTDSDEQTIDVAEFPTVIWVRVSRPDGCFTVDSISLSSACSIFVPNAFSPNGDGINDVFTFVGPNVETMEMIVYNRYGHRVFYSIDPDEMWDGTNGWDDVYAQAVYVYRISGTFRSGKAFLKTGNVTLIR